MGMPKARALPACAWQLGLLPNLVGHKVVQLRHDVLVGRHLLLHLVWRGRPSLPAKTSTTLT
jgi:hypothetical protein